MKTLATMLVVWVAFDGFCKFIWLATLRSDFPSSRTGAGIDAFISLIFVCWFFYLLGQA